MGERTSEQGVLCKKIIGIGFPKTGTSTLKKALEILGFNEGDDFMCGDYVHGIRWDRYDYHILTIRKNSETWYNSVLKWSQKPDKRTKYFRKFRKDLYGAEMPDGNKELYINAYANHIMKCTMWNPIILCWEDGDGWDRLCNYLDVPVPNVDFPHENKNK